MDTLTPTAGLGSLATPIVQDVTKGIAAKIILNLGKISKVIVDRSVSSLQIGFSEYLQRSYDKAKIFKSILNGDLPLSTLDHYVNLDLKISEDTISDEKFLDKIEDFRRVVVTGLAGGGKSMFMKYITVKFFELPRSVIPLYIEFRHMNNITDIDLLSYVRTSCSGKGHYVNQEQFELVLRGGSIALFMDGFDELNYDIRDEVERQLLAIERDFPNAIVVISSRPDPRFSSWQSYYVLNVCALNSGQINKLIESFEYDSAVKRRFQKEVESRLIKTHNSFLSSPLLASIMLLTYEEYAEIPEKMNSFYGRAFDVLFQKHDAQKDQFRRKRYTGLSREDFRSVFAAFCAMSYIEEKISFIEDELGKYSKSSIKYFEKENGGSRRVDSDALIKDLIESVCMLKHDGLDVTFVHRSFQEYFAALFVCGLRGEKVKKFLDAYSERMGDNVISMTVEMSKYIVDEFWAAPLLDDVIKIFEIGKKSGDWTDAYAAIFPSFHLRIEDDCIAVRGFSISKEYFCRLDNMGRAYKSYQLVSKMMNFSGTLYIDELIKIAGEDQSKLDFVDSIASNLDGNIDKVIDKSDRWWLDELNVSENCEAFLIQAKSLRREISLRLKGGGKILDELFD